MSEAKKRLVAAGYAVPFILITSLFFLWGYARSVLDVLNKHFQDLLSISVADSTLVQASTYVAYALMALPAGILISRKGYRVGIIVGLLLFAFGAFLFIPGGMTMKFGIFLLALFIIGCGLAFLETSANPYITELGPASTAASRLNLAQSFNGLGCILGPLTIGTLLFSDADASVAKPYTLMGIIVLLMAIVFTRIKLPEITPLDPEENPSDKSDLKSVGRSIGILFRSSDFRMGLMALFFYEVAEISINSLFINYAVSDGWLSPLQASQVLSFGALGLFMLARVIGSFVMSRVKPSKVLRICGALTVAGALLVAGNFGLYSHAGIFICYAFEAIMFPTIFAMTIKDCGEHSKIASSFLMMTPLGGALGSWIMGIIITKADISAAFLVPAIAYAIVTLYAVTRNRKSNLNQSKQK